MDGTYIETTFFPDGNESQFKTQGDHKRYIILGILMVWLSISLGIPNDLTHTQLDKLWKVMLIYDDLPICWMVICHNYFIILYFYIIS